MTIWLKDGVKPAGMRPELLLGMIVALSVYQKYEYDFVITSLLDSKHSRGSLHYSGAAVDLRTRHMKQEHKRLIANEINEALGPDYDVILEKDHIHMEFQPKG